MEIKKTIVITSIFKPTLSVKKFSEIKNCNLIVVADKKTPENWNSENVNFISVNKQAELSFELSKTLPYNHYSRKMIGYLIAIQNKADYIIDTDDDNIPKNNWSFPGFSGNFDCTEKNKGFVNIYQLFTKQKIWPRGLPLKYINKKYKLEEKISTKNIKIGIWQGLADEDPDVDAIYRLTNDSPCYFEDRNPVVLEKGTICPFNTQNTIITKELFPLMYLPTYVTFRFTDILRGLIAQPIMWLYNYRLGFCSATVVQKRNPHDYMKDFISEIPMYEHTEKVIELVKQTISKTNTIQENLTASYQALYKEGIVIEKELATLNSWLADLANLSKL